MAPALCACPHFRKGGESAHQRVRSPRYSEWPEGWILGPRLQTKFGGAAWGRTQHESALVASSKTKTNLREQTGDWLAAVQQLTSKDFAKSPSTSICAASTLANEQHKAYAVNIKGTYGNA